MECSGVHPTTQFADRKGLCTCDALLCLLHTLPSALESEQEARILHIDFSTAFDSFNYQGILYKLGSVGIVGLLRGKVWVLVMLFCGCPTHYRVHSKVGRRL